MDDEHGIIIDGKLQHYVPQSPVLVIIESPLKGYYARNRAYARACMLDSLKRGEAPFAGHLLYAQEGILDDTDPPQREMGIAAHLAWTGVAKLVAVYGDLGISDGMTRGIERAKERGIPFTRRYGVWDDAEKARWAKFEAHDTAMNSMRKGL